MSSVTFRPSSGISTTCSLLMSWPTAVLRVSTIDELATTVMVSSNAPTLSTTSMLGFELTCRTMPSCT